MSTHVASPSPFPSRRSWARGAAIALAGLTVAVGLGMGIQSSTPEAPSPAHPRVMEHEPIVDTRRPQDLANDRRGRQSPTGKGHMPATGSIRPR